MPFGKIEAMKGVLLKTFSPNVMAFNDRSKLTVDKEEQLANAESSISMTPVGIVTEVRPAQSLKAFGLIFVMPVGILIVVMAVPANIPFVISMRSGGNVMDLRAEQP